MIRFVFRPLEKFPREFTKKRRRSGYGTTLPRTYALLEYELKQLKVDGDVVVQVAVNDAEIRRDGLLRAGVTPPHPGVVISFVATIGGSEIPLSYAADAFLTWQENVRAIVLGLERLRLVDQSGITKSGEQYRGWAALPAPEPVNRVMDAEEAAMFLASVGGRPKDAILESPETAKAAYHTAAMKLHPDKGGAIEQWDYLARAWAAISKLHRL